MDIDSSGSGSAADVRQLELSTLKFSWRIKPSRLQLYKHADGQPHSLGSGAFGAVSHDPSALCQVACTSHLQEAGLWDWDALLCFCDGSNVLGVCGLSARDKAVLGMHHAICLCLQSFSVNVCCANSDLERTLLLQDCNLSQAWVAAAFRSTKLAWTGSTMLR